MDLTKQRTRVHKQKVFEINLAIYKISIYLCVTQLLPNSAYPCFLAETADSCVHQPSGCHCACMCNVMLHTKQWNLLCVNRKNELLTVSKTRIAPVSDLWRRSTAGSLPCDAKWGRQRRTSTMYPVICKLGGSVHAAELNRTTNYNYTTAEGVVQQSV